MPSALDLQQAKVQAPIARAPFHTWAFPDGTLWTEFYRLEAGFLLRFPDLADFEISGDGHASVAHPVPGVSVGTVEHLYLNQVLPLMLSTQGQLVFHASAVAIDSGVAVFAGESGRGKSTLAASFAVNGYPFLTDDGLVLNRSATGYTVLPSHPSIRLWADSSEALIGSDTPTAPVVCYTSKSRFLAGEQVRFCDCPQPLRHVYFLGEGIAEAVTIEPLSPAQALIEWVKNSFLLDIEAHLRLASHFNQVTNLAALPIHFRLDYPRNYTALADVRQAILTHTGLGDGIT
ncbi:hypothetical protein KBY96_12195 [Cyanobium sp. ATX 6A2]|uniref:hypothetical protein n=1 Tax=Cyanobium sp. ATX 6A2 TaxID=2823700 RepID=UPI0020CE5D4F|nr:hypothetical protein [Cyanobium sp. ATX 6A2]MCP9888682.1 hypothetical protein [Cyanobium sp. ATX 6A2]